ncbi:sensor histidine kinase [Larkinella terrae]|nr:sensor histidine kinase [Larkinella terrae]
MTLFLKLQLDFASREWKPFSGISGRTRRFLLLPALLATYLTGLAQNPQYLKLQPHKLLYADTVYREAIAKNDSLLLAEAYYLYGKTYGASGDKVTAHRWYLKSLKILEPRGDSFELCRLYIRIYESQVSYEESWRYILLAQGIAQRLNSYKAWVRVYGSRSNFYTIDWSEGGLKPHLPKPRFDSALYYLHKISPLLYKHRDTNSIVENMMGIGHIHKILKKPETGIKYLTNALKLATIRNEEGQKMKLMMDLADGYLAIGQPQKAWVFLTQAQKLYNRSPFNDFFIRGNFENLYYTYYRLTGHWKQALKHSENLREIERNDFVTERNAAVSRLNMEFKAEQKDALLKAQKNELALRTETLRAQQRLTWAVSALLLVAAVLCTVFFILYRKNRRISIRNAELVKEQNHRVKNNLQVVSSLLNLQSRQLVDETAKKAVEESQLRVQAMAILHRRLYDGDGLVTVNLDEFIQELVTSVIRTFGYSEIRTVFDLAPVELSANDALSLGLIVNELTTNACKYAFPDHPDPVFQIVGEKQENVLKLTIADNGPGLPAQAGIDDSLTQRKTFGMRLIQIQVNQLAGVGRFSSQPGVRFEMQFKI